LGGGVGGFEALSLVSLKPLKVEKRDGFGTELLPNDDALLLAIFTQQQQTNALQFWDGWNKKGLPFYQLVNSANTATK
jgi:hypothetical protein